MTPSDWLYEVKEELLQVQSDNQIFTVGVKGKTDGVELSLEDLGFSSRNVKGRTGEVELSVTLTEQSDCIEAYVVAEPIGSTGIDGAVNAVNEVTQLLATEEHKDRSIGTQRDDKWAEVNIEVDPASVESL